MVEPPDPAAGTAIEENESVLVHYRLLDEHGEELESSSSGGAVELVACAPNIIPGVAHSLVGMQLGQRYRLTLDPEQAFGDGRSTVERTIARRDLPDAVRPGDAVQICYGPTRCILWIREITGGYALATTRHPLAGKRVVVELFITHRAR